MGLNPFATVSTYTAMLNKIGLFTFVVLIAVIALISWQVPATRSLIPALMVKVPGTDVELPLSVLIGASIFAFLFRTIKLHDRISDILGIRRRFDILCILFPMASAAGAALSLDQQDSVWQNRRELMRTVFYRYASSSKGRAQIEEHAITMALDQWSWYWICVEAACVTLLAGLVLIVSGKCMPALYLLASCFPIIWLLQGIKELCRGYAKDEIRQILDDPLRKAAVLDVFHAL